MSRSRGWRRFQGERVRMRARRVMREVWGKRDDDWVEWAVRRFANDMPSCSCPICSRGRRYHGAPIQEVRELRRVELDLV